MQRQEWLTEQGKLSNNVVYARLKCAAYTAVCLCVSVCVCVSVGGRERERERESAFICSSILLYAERLRERTAVCPSKSMFTSLSLRGTHIVYWCSVGLCVCVCVCVPQWVCSWRAGAKEEAAAKDAGKVCSFGVLLPVCFSLYGPSSAGWGWRVSPSPRGPGAVGTSKLLVTTGSGIQLNTHRQMHTNTHSHTQPGLKQKWWDR